MEIVVLGGGVIGVTTAYYLARDGHEVTVLDRQPQAASETSFANAGLIAPGHAYTWASPRAPKILIKSLFRDDQAFKLRLKADPRMWAWLFLFTRQCTDERARLNTIRKLRLCLYSQEVLHEVVKDTGVSYDSCSGGLLYFYRSAEGFERGIANSVLLCEHELPLEIVDRDRVVELEPALTPVKDRIAGAIYAPSDESGEPICSAVLWRRSVKIRWASAWRSRPRSEGSRCRAIGLSASSPTKALSPPMPTSWRSAATARA
jgi:D-amino-acid dehydrogenase